jgi:hypothetical protein
MKAEERNAMKMNQRQKMQGRETGSQRKRLKFGIAERKA